MRLRRKTDHRKRRLLCAAAIWWKFVARRYVLWVRLCERQQRQVVRHGVLDEQRVNSWLMEIDRCQRGQGIWRLIGDSRTRSDDVFPEGAIGPLRLFP